MKAKILETLKSTDAYVSGQQLCETLGVSRTAIWKVIGRLKEEGYEIDCIRNKGYRLLGEPDLFSAEEIRKHLQTKTLAGKVFFYEETGSTNNDCKLLMEQNSPASVLAAAANQNAGKGRRGRQWSSPKNTSVSFSLGLVPDFEAEKASMLTLLMALAVCKAIEETTSLEAGIKWPNDIVIDGKKVCGILTEMHLEMEVVSSVVIGVGINALQLEFEPQIETVATSLLLEMQRLGLEQKPARAQLTAACINHFEKIYETFLQTLDLGGLKEAYEKRMVNLDREVRVLDPKGEFSGVAKGINDRGELLVETADGQITSVYAGEVSVRGVLGYT